MEDLHDVGKMTSEMEKAVTAYLEAEVVVAVVVVVVVDNDDVCMKLVCYQRANTLCEVLPLI
jgi:hypothetical protein